MWALLSSRFRRWLVMAIVVPLVGLVARDLSRRIESRYGSNRASRTLGHVGNVAKSPRQRKKAAKAKR